ncbi:hypothetical protein RUM43_010408 [Polyplax serrata]|uniref:Uncharacterized protein n=1 Tax=Polyplax serrata TaxID=468196 RepID=A0AAN8S9Z4_POLSC
MALRTVCIIILAVGSSVSSRIIEQWPVIPETKPPADFLFNFEGTGNKKWDEFYGLDQDIKPVKEVQAIIVTKNVHVPYHVDNYLAYRPEENFPYSVPLEKKVPLPYQVKKIVPVPVGPGVSYAVGKVPNFHSVPYSLQFFNVPVRSPGAIENKIPIKITHTLHLGKKVPVGYPGEHQLPHPEVPYPFPVHINVPVEQTGSELAKHPVPETLILEKSRPQFSFYLVPFPVEKLKGQGTQETVNRENDNLEKHVNPPYYSSIKSQEGRNQLYSVTHKLYNNLSEEKKPPQIVDFNHPIDHDEE